MDFQTPEWACKIMVNMIEGNPKLILEPTPGQGNLVKVLKDKFPNSEIIAPQDFYKIGEGRFDYIVSNPPFTPMKKGYQLLEEFFGLSDNIIILMPWLALINSERRTNKYINNGLKSVTHLPRKAFGGARVQTCILEFRKGYNGNIIFKTVNTNQMRF